MARRLITVAAIDLGASAELRWLLLPAEVSNQLAVTAWGLAAPNHFSTRGH
jgi:hypothetical protein